MASGDCDDDSPFYLYLDDIYDEIEIEEEISTSSTNATAAPGKKRRAADVKEAEGGTKRKRKVLEYFTIHRTLKIPYSHTRDHRGCLASWP